METSELLEIISREEDSKHQFKADFTNPDSLAAEMVAFSNSGGGQIFIGVNNDGTITGLTRTDIGRLNQMISNAASQSIHPPINPLTENIKLSDGLVLVVNIVDGIGKPYITEDGRIWVKKGSDKRRVISREEIQRMFQSSGLIHADESLANGITIADIDNEYFSNFFHKEYDRKVEDIEIGLPKLLENMNLAKEGIFNIAGALIFSKNPQFRLPVFIVKAISYPENDIDVQNYNDSQDLTGKLSDVYQKSMNFILNNLRTIQKDKGINSLGTYEIPRIVLEELLVNALIHRDYFISAPIRIMIFLNRIEIISPGHLPNNLTVENIKSGISNIRNPVITSFATKILPYRGLGNGIRRALKYYSDIDFINDTDNNLFKVIIKKNLF